MNSIDSSSDMYLCATSSFTSACEMNFNLGSDTFNGFSFLKSRQVMNSDAAQNLNLSSSVILPETRQNPMHFHIQVRLRGRNRSLKTAAMVNSGATSIFISERFVKKNHVITAPLERPIVLLNIDGSQNKAGTIQQYTELYLSTGDRETKWKMLVTDTGPEDLVLGLPWLRHANPDIDWEKGEMRLRASEEAVEPPVHEVEIQKIAANRRQ